MEIIKKRDVIQEADLSYAKKIGIEEGIKKGILQIVKSMIRAGYSYEQVSEIYPLSKEDYDNLRIDLQD